MTLKYGLEVTQKSLKLVPFESLVEVSYSPSIVTMAVSVAVCKIFNAKELCDLENRSEFVQGHWKWHAYELGLLFTFHSNYCAILYRLRAIVTYW